MKIIVDAMGGDFAPQAPVEGAISAAKELGVEIILVGRKDSMQVSLGQLGHKKVPAGIELLHADGVIEVEDNPATALREKKDSSMVVGLNLLKEGRGDAFVSAGSTGALLSAATLLIKRVRGIRRAALAPLIPSGDSKAVLIDCGATVDGTPEYLLQFAFMGSYYAKRMLGLPEPRVGLLNIGKEATKGTDLQRETHALLTKADKEGRLHFIGNVEATEAIHGGADVIVSDGFSGNLLLKTYEGTAKYVNGLLKKAFTKGIGTKLAAMLVMGELNQMKKMLDPNEVGGTALLGISKPVFKAHGSSNAYAIRNAISQAKDFAKSNIIADITENIEHMRLDAEI